MAQIDQIRSLGEEMQKNAELKIDEENPKLQHMTVNRDVLVKAYENAGITTDQVDAFVKTSTIASRSLHFAATKANIERVKEAVSKGEDYRGMTTEATLSFNRNFSLDAKSVVERRGVTKLHGDTPTKYCKFNYGGGNISMDAGMPSEVLNDLKTEMVNAVSPSKYFEGE